MGNKSSACKGDGDRLYQRQKNVGIVRKYFKTGFYQYPYKIDKEYSLPLDTNATKLGLTNLNPIAFDELNNFNYFFQPRQNTGSISSLNKWTGSMGQIISIIIIYDLYSSNDRKEYIGKIKGVDVSTYIEKSFDNDNKSIYLCLYKMLHYCTKLTSEVLEYTSERINGLPEFEKIKKLLVEEGRFKDIAISIGDDHDNLIDQFMNKHYFPLSEVAKTEDAKEDIENISIYLLYNHIATRLEIFINNNGALLDIDKIETCNPMDKGVAGHHAGSETVLSELCPNFQILYATFMVPIKFDNENVELLINEFWKIPKITDSFKDNILGDFTIDVINHYLYNNLSSCNLYQIQISEPVDDSAFDRIEEEDVNLLPFQTESILAQFIFAIYALHKAGISHNSIDWQHMSLALVPSVSCYYYNDNEGAGGLYYKIDSYGVELKIINFRKSTELEGEKCVKHSTPYPLNHNLDILMFGCLIAEFIEDRYRIDDATDRTELEDLDAITKEGEIIKILEELFGLTGNSYKQLITEIQKSEDIKTLVETKFKDMEKIDLKRFFRQVSTEITAEEIPENANIYTFESILVG